MLPHEPRAVQPDLWSRLEALDLDGASAFPFSRRLARDNNWPPAYARRVVVEYKKFIFLAATCGHPVTPSDEVDQAWHLHLVYTRSYWEDLCGELLGFALHHGPTTGGAAEGHKFQDWYARTLQSYRAAFGTLPPADIWPPAAVRFGEAPHFRRVNLRRHFLLPRPRWSAPRSRRALLLVAVAAVLVGCTARTPLNPLNWYGTEFLYLYWTLCLTLFPLALWLRYKGRGPENLPSLTAPPATYEVVRLAHRGTLVADSALAALVHTGHIELLPEQRLRRTTAAPPTEQYERAVWNLIAYPGGSTLKEVRQQALAPNIQVLRSLDKELEDKGLLLPAVERQRLNQIPDWTALGLAGFGVTKMLVGLSRDRPVLWLGMSLVGLIFAYMASRQYQAWATGLGTRLLREMKVVVQEEKQTGSLSAHSVALIVALFGVAELNALGMGHVADWLAPPSTSSSDGSSGDGGGDGGSGCGSGCGGCGGD